MNIPQQIKNLDRFVLWRMEEGRKIPYSPNGRKAATNKPATWCRFTEAIEALEDYTGIGFVLGDGVMGIDLDNVIDDDGSVCPQALEVIEEIPGYVEISPSGRGLHILTRAALPKDRGQIKFKWIEFYDETTPRYLTLTGRVWEGRGEINDEDASDAVAYVYRRVLGEEDGEDAKLLERIRKSKQGKKFSALYDHGDWKSISYPSASEGVAALLAILAFWTKKDEKRMDRLFRGSAMFDAKKWNRLGAEEIKNACLFCSNTIGAPQCDIEFPDIGPRGAILATIPNLQAALDYHDITIRYDEIRKKFKYEFKGENEFSVDNNNNASLGQLISTLETAGVSTQHLRSFLCTVADRNRINPVRDWILSEPWDREDRILAICDTLETKPDYPDDLKELLVRKWLLSAVAAACHDPKECPFMTRGVLTLVGGQYIGKTRWISTLAPRKWILVGHNLNTESKDKVREAISHWICELGELESTMKKDMGKLKAFLTLEIDKLRIPFAEDISEYPRRTVFAASVNRPDFLVDDTGNSRFWSIPVTRVHYDHNVDMQQLYAQLYENWKAGEQWWLTQEEDTRLAQYNEMHEERDEVYDLVTSRIDWEQTGAVEWLTPTDVLIKRCGIEHPTKSQRNSCARVLRKMTGMEKGKKTYRGSAARYPIPLMAHSI